MMLIYDCNKWKIEIFSAIMVKLFVGGLPDGVDSIRLRQLFSQFVIVNECDVIKDYAFVVCLLYRLFICVGLCFTLLCKYLSQVSVLCFMDLFRLKQLKRASREGRLENHQNSLVVTWMFKQNSPKFKKRRKPLKKSWFLKIKSTPAIYANEGITWGIPLLKNMFQC